MRIIIKNIMLVIVTEPKTIDFDLPKDFKNSLNHEIDFIIKHYEFLAEHTIKSKITLIFSKYKHGSNIHEHRKQ